VCILLVILTYIDTISFPFISKEMSKYYVWSHEDSEFFLQMVLVVLEMVNVYFLRGD